MTVALPGLMESEEGRWVMCRGQILRSQQKASKAEISEITETI